MWGVPDVPGGGGGEGSPEAWKGQVHVRCAGSWDRHVGRESGGQGGPGPEAKERIQEAELETPRTGAIIHAFIHSLIH